MIQVEDLSFTYNKADSSAVDGLSFEIESGEVIGFPPSEVPPEVPHAS